MPKEGIQSSTLLDLPLELRSLIFHEVARTYILNILTRDRRIILADACIDNTCCSMHSKKATSTANSLALVSRQVAVDAHRAVFHRVGSPVSAYFSSTCALSDFEYNHELYQPSSLKEFCLSSTQNILVKAPPAWQALPLPGECFRALARVKVTGLSNVFHLDVLRVSLSWAG